LNTPPQNKQTGCLQMNRAIAFCLITFSNTSYAIDVSPYVDGQKLSHTQAKELQQRYNNREQQAWKEPDSAKDNHHKTMKKKTIRLILLLSFGLELSSCSFGASMSQQMTSLNVGCKSDDVKISNEVVDLNGEESWTAECDGKTYYCTYFPESDTGCYEVKK
jgi:hypothetical protein